MTERVTITLPDGLVSDIDEIAAGSDRSRSSVIREASARYVTEHRATDEASQRRGAIEDALAYLDTLASLPVQDDRSTGELLRELRGPLDDDRVAQLGPAGS